jgi:hypothetical protein
MAPADWSGTRKRRTRGHIIADLSVNFLERQVLQRGHQLLRVPQPEYGTDAIMNHFSPDTGEIENGRVEFQLKATDHLQLVDDGKSITCTVEMAHLQYWYYGIAHPFVLIEYDAQTNRAYWLDVQAYVDHRNLVEELPASDSVTLRIPVRNKVTLRAIDRFRALSLARIQSLSR